jgi:hypothetical protein
MLCAVWQVQRYLRKVRTTCGPAEVEGELVVLELAGLLMRQVRGTRV